MRCLPHSLLKVRYGPDLLSMQSTISGSNHRKRHIVCSYMVNISACAGTARIVVMHQPLYRPLYPSIRYTLVNASVNVLNAYL